jgi:hypothetical protein
MILTRKIYKRLTTYFFSLFIVASLLITTQALTVARDLSRYNQGQPCTMSVSGKKFGSMNFKGRLHEYPRSGFCCVAQPLALNYKNSKVNQFISQAFKAALSETPNYDNVIANINRVLKIASLSDAKRALFAANAAKNGANISQSKQLGDCSLSSGQWLWIRITGTGDTFGRF